MLTRFKNALLPASLKRLCFCLFLLCMLTGVSAQQLDYAQRDLDIKIGNANYQKGKPGEEQALKELEQQAHAMANYEIECDTWNKLADLYYSQEKEKELFEVYDTLIVLTEKHGVKDPYYSVSSTKSLFLLRQHKIRDAYDICLNTLRKANADNYDKGLYVSYIMMARFFNTNKMNESAIKECVNAMEIEKTLEDHAFGTGLMLALNCSQENESWDKSLELIEKYGTYITEPKYQALLLCKEIIIDYWKRRYKSMMLKEAQLAELVSRHDLTIKADDQNIMDLISLIRSKKYQEARQLVHKVNIPLQFSFQTQIFYDLQMSDSLFMVIQNRNAFYNSREEALYNSNARREQLEMVVDTLTVKNEELEVATSKLRSNVYYLMTLAVAIFLAMVLFAAFIYIATNRKYTRDLQARNKQIEKANQFKTQFVQNMSHEVRTPLNAICGFSQILANPDMADILTQEEKEQYSDIINSSTDMLTSLVNDILDIGDIESGKYRIYVQEVDVTTVCQKSINTVEHRLMGRPVELKFVTEVPEGFTIQSDPARIQQVLVNYLTNAIKHTEEGSIVLKVEPLEGMRVRFSVTDTGEGVDPANAEAIFQRFEKLNTFKQGTGLGLPICRSLAICLEGKAYLDTTYTAGGARFNLDL